MMITPVNFYCDLSGVRSNQTASIYRTQICSMLKLSEQYGYRGFLSHFNLSMIDPWVISSVTMGMTERIVPIIAVQPYYMNPVAVAKMIHSLFFFHGRKVNINLILGASESELMQVQDPIDPSVRSRRLKEFIHILYQLLTSTIPVSFDGEFYRYKNILLQPTFQDNIPEFFISGSSNQSIELATYADVSITHPKPINEYIDEYVAQVKAVAHPNLRLGIRIGIIAREESAQAWDYAEKIYQFNRNAEITLAYKKNSHSKWIREMALLSKGSSTFDNVYWMGGFKSGIAYNPIFVGNYYEVSAYILKYIKVGVRDIIVSGLNNVDDFIHTDRVFKLITEMQKNNF